MAGLAQPLPPRLAAEGPISGFATDDASLGILHPFLGWSQSWWHWGGATVPMSPRSSHLRERPGCRTPVPLSSPPPINSFPMPPQPLLVPRCTTAPSSHSPQLCTGALVVLGLLCPLGGLSPLQREVCLGNCALLSLVPAMARQGLSWGVPWGPPSSLLVPAGLLQHSVLGAAADFVQLPRVRGAAAWYENQQPNPNFSEVCKNQSHPPTHPAPGLGHF